MKLNFAASLLAVASVGAFANTIDWTIDNLDTTGLKGNASSDKWQYVFLTDASGKYTTESIDSLSRNSGLNSGVEEDDGAFIGTWNDSGTTPSTVYVVALYDGDGGEYNYFANSSGELFHVTASQLMESTNPTSGSYGGNPSGSTALALLNAGPDSTGALGGGAYSTANVPEPATAALALLGVALMVRRRK